MRRPRRRDRALRPQCETQSAAHAITLRPHLPVPGNRRLPVQPPNERLRIRHLRRFGQSLRERQQLRDWGCRAGVRGWGFLDAIEWIHHKHRIAGFGEPFAHLAECRTQPEDIRPYKNAWSRAARRMHEVAVGGAVRCHHAHVGFGHRDRVRDLRQHHGHARSQQDAELPPCHQTEILVLLTVLLKLILITHIRSLSTPRRAVDRTHKATFYTHSASCGSIGLVRFAWKFNLAPTVNCRPSEALLIRPNKVELMSVFGLSNTGWFNTFVTSIRNSSCRASNSDRATAAALYERRFFLQSTKYRRSWTAATDIRNCRDCTKRRRCA